MNTPDQFNWMCLSCGRRVPRRVHECRCGFRQPAATAEVRKRSAASRSKVLVSVGTGLLIAVSAFSMRSLWTPAPAEALPVSVEAAAPSPLALEPIPETYVPPFPEMETAAQAPTAPALTPRAVTPSSPIAASSPAPLATMQGAGAAAAPAQSDQLRASGEAAYRKAMASAQRHAGQVDDLWNRYAPTCVAQGTTTGDRPWLAALEPGGVTLTAVRSARRADGKSTNCQRWLDDIVKYANHVRGEVTQAAEHARQSGVYPGVVRDIRREYRLEWSGW